MVLIVFGIRWKKVDQGLKMWTTRGSMGWSQPHVGMSKYNSMPHSLCFVSGIPIRFLLDTRDLAPKKFCTSWSKIFCLYISFYITPLQGHVHLNECCGLNYVPQKDNAELPVAVNVTKWKQGLCRDNQVKMRSYWIRVGPSPVWPMSFQEWERHADIHTQTYTQTHTHTD